MPRGNKPGSPNTVHLKGKRGEAGPGRPAALSEQERMCLESYDIAKGNVDRSDDSLETVIKPRWYPKDKALELCARSLGMLKDTVHVTTSEETLARLDEWKAANLRARQITDRDDGDDPDISRVN
jgi:hypothetical protein